MPAGKEPEEEAGEEEGKEPGEEPGKEPAAGEEGPEFPFFVTVVLINNN